MTGLAISRVTGAPGSSFQLTRDKPGTDDEAAASSPQKGPNGRLTLTIAAPPSARAEFDHLLEHLHAA